MDESGCFFYPKHNVHILNGVACLTFYQVVYQAYYYKFSCPFVYVEGNIAEVAATYGGAEL